MADYICPDCGNCSDCYDVCIICEKCKDCSGDVNFCNGCKQCDDCHWKIEDPESEDLLREGQVSVSLSETGDCPGTPTYSVSAAYPLQGTIDGTLLNLKNMINSSDPGAWADTAAVSISATLEKCTFRIPVVDYEVNLKKYNDDFYDAYEGDAKGEYAYNAARDLIVNQTKSILAAQIMKDGIPSMLAGYMANDWAAIFEEELFDANPFPASVENSIEDENFTFEWGTEVGVTVGVGSVSVNNDGEMGHKIFHEKLLENGWDDDYFHRMSSYGSLNVSASGANWVFGAGIDASYVIFGDDGGEYSLSGAAYLRIFFGN